MEKNEKFIRIRALLQIVGKPKEYVEEKMKEYMEKIKEDDNLMLVHQKIGECKEEQNVWSVVGEIEVVIKGHADLIGFCIDYMPSSIEIIKPEQFSFSQRDFTAYVNDLIGKLHKVDAIAKQAGMENQLLRKNMKGIVRNAILIMLKFGIRSKEKLCKGTGLKEEELTVFLEALKKDGRVEEKNGEFVLTGS